MPQRLQDILSQLYRPPIDGTRQVFTLSRSDAERLPQLPLIAVISITSPGCSPANISDFTHVLRLSFADVDFLNPGLSEKARSKLPHVFTEQHSDAIRSFVEALPEEICSLVIHCEGGYSRSCAVAIALHQLYGYKVELQYLSEANSSIVRVMTGDVPGHRKSKKTICG
jgi:predicted protein tyrosine phosphatase